MKRIYLTLDDRLYDRILETAEAKGLPPSSVVVKNLEDLYFMKTESIIDYDNLLENIFREAQTRDSDPFVLADLSSFSDLIIVTAENSHVSPSTLRARIGKAFNSAVKKRKVGNVERATTADGKLKNKAGIAMYVNKSKENGE